jgi:hypothetical protein
MIADDDATLAKEDAALDLVTGRKGDRIARALNLLGWMIVPQPGVCQRPWPMWGEHDCPAWAEPSRLPKRPGLRLIEGGKDDAT